MFGLPLELQILFVNVLGLVSTTLNWNWFKWDQQLEKISNVSVSQSDKLNVENIDWLKTILSWIVVTRFIIDRISLLAYVANIYTVVTRSRHNLLILWMVLSFLKDIILEVVVIIITFLLWHATKESFPTSLLVEFVVDKIISLSVISTGKWCTTLKWYMQLQKMAKIRKFTIIARKSIASIANMPGRVGRSLDDECLGIAIIRRGKYASLLNLDRHSEESFNRMNAKSLSTLTDDTSSTNGANGANGTNDYNSNDLSVAEKSMRMLNVTAEDVMDARARIQERSYWKEQETIKTPEVKKDVIKQLPLEKNEEETINSARNTQLTENNLAKIVNSTSRKEDSMEYIPVKKKEEKGNGETILVDEKEQILTENQNNVSLKSGNVTSDKVNHAKSTESHDIYESKKKREEKKEGVGKIVQCPSFQCMNARNTEAKPCASLIRKLETKYCPVSVNRRKWIDRVDRKEYPYEVSTQLTPTSSSTSKKERYKILKISCGCHRALHNDSKNGKHVRSIGINGKNVDFDINRKEFESFKPIVNMQRSKIDKSAFKYSEVYRLKKQIQKWEEFYGKHSRGSKSLAETARSSAYAKDVFDASDKLSVVNCRKSVQTETYDESMMMSDSMSERHRLKYKQKRSRRPVNLRSVHDVASFREMNYSEAREVNMKALETNNNFTLENKRETKAKKRRDLLPANRKLSIEQREAIELKALKAYNELTLSEDKRELEVRKDRDSSLNHRRLTKESEVLKMKVLKTYNDSLLEDKKKMERTRTYNLSPSFQQSIDERSTSRVCNELKQSGSKRERTRRKRDSSRDETLSECEKVETPASVSNRLPISSCENTMISTHQNIHSNFHLNDYARQARMSLNLWEITRNIEWTVHPRGIILINKNLQSQYLKNERFRESQQRDIVDDSTASTLHSAFFFKPEIVTRVFRRVHNQTRIDEFFSRFPTFLRQDFDMEFACQMNNEVVVRHWNSPLDCDLERMMGNDRNNLEEQFNVNDNTTSNTTSEHDHDLCIIVIDQEQVSNESQIAIEDSMTVGTQENIENIQMTNILVFNENRNHVDNATNDNLPIQLITDALRNFNIETEGSICDAALPIEECEDVSNANECNNSQPRELKVDDINFNEENNNESDRISSHKNAEIDDTIHKIEQLLDSNDNCLDNVNVTSYVNSLEKLDNSRDEKKLSTIDVLSERENNLSLKNIANNTSQLYDNNNNKQFDTLDNETEKSTFNHVCKNSSKLSSSSSSSLIKSNNCHAVRSSDEKLQKLTHLSDSATTLNDQKRESESNLKDTNYTIPQLYDRIPRCRSIEISKLETTIPDGTRNQNENKDEEANEFLAEEIFKVHSDDELQQIELFKQNASFYYRNDDPGTPVSFNDGSLMEEFLNDPVPSLNSSFS